MAKSDLIQRGDMDFATQMRTFKNAIGKHAARLGLTPEQVAAQAADTDFFDYVVIAQHEMLTSAQAWTVTKKTLRKGESDGSENPAPQKVIVPKLPEPAPPAVPPGVEARFRALLRRIKASPNYNLSIGQELGIEAVEQTAPDFTALKPALAARVISGHVELKWSWQQKRAFLDMCELQVDRNDGQGFGMLTFSTRTKFMDKTPFPEKPARWTYRAIYRAGDQAVGNWSSPVSVLVPG